MIFPNFKPYVHCDKSSYEFNFMRGERFAVVTEKGKYLFVHKVVAENTQKKKY